jgi:RNA polymerase sigma factor (TIGR02999 family)
MEEKKDVQALISSAEAGDSRAAEQLFGSLYHELHRLAEHNLHRGGAPSTLGATTLLHEAYLNLAERDGIAFPDRARFLSYASRAMRGLVIDYVRRRRAMKRGRQFEITLAEDQTPPTGLKQSAADLEQLSDALNELAVFEPELAQLVDLHFFCGYTFAEIAAFWRVSERTVQREWRKARLLLQHGLAHENTPGEPNA